jgi:hypothetical protein
VVLPKLPDNSFTRDESSPNGPPTPDDATHGAPEDASGVVDKSNWNTPEHFLAILQKEHAVTCNLLLQKDKFAKKLEEKLAKKDQDALAKTEKMKTKHLEEKKRIRNDAASDKDKHMKKIKKIK